MHQSKEVSAWKCNVYGALLTTEGVKRHARKCRFVDNQADDKQVFLGLDATYAKASAKGGRLRYLSHAKMPKRIAWASRSAGQLSANHSPVKDRQTCPKRLKRFRE